MQGSLPDLAEKGIPLLFRTKEEATQPDLHENEDVEAEDWGKESFQAQSMRDY
jgi:hypothetical protein